MTGWLFGILWNMNFMTFHSVENGIIIPTDFNSIIFQSGRSTTSQMIIYLPSTVEFPNRVFALAMMRDFRQVLPVVGGNYLSNNRLHVTLTK